MRFRDNICVIGTVPIGSGHMECLEWSVDKCNDYFQVSQYLIWKSRDFAKENGALSLPLQKKGKSVSNQFKEEIVLFYEVTWSPENCRAKKESFLQTSRSCTLFSSQNILLCKLDFQSLQFMSKVMCSSWFIWNTLCLCVLSSPKHKINSCTTWCVTNRTIWISCLWY